MKQGFTAAITLIYNARTRLEVFKNERGVTMGAKRMINGMINRLGAALNEAQFNMSREDRKKVENEVLNTDSSLQIENLIDLVLGLDKEGRETVELFIEALKKGEVEVA